MEHLRRLHEEYSSEIPNEVLSNKGKFKVRRNWWTAVVGYFDELRYQNQIPPAFKGEVDDFIDYYTSAKFHRQPLTSLEDINRVNDLLDRFLKPEGK